MKVSQTKWGRGLAALALSATLPMTGHAAKYHDDGGGLVEVDNEPPPPGVEVAPVAPFHGAVWVGGRWLYRGGRHEWFAGRHARPRRGYVYAPHRWLRSGNRWRYEPGRWHR